MFSPHYFQNITGFYREADAHYLNLSDPSSSNSSHHFFRHLQGEHPDSKKHHILPLVNQTIWNETEASGKRGDFDWEGVSSWSLTINEKKIIARDVNGDIIVEDRRPSRKNIHGAVDEQDEWDDWSWIHMVGYRRSRQRIVKLSNTTWRMLQSSLTISNADKTSMLDYNIAGVHQRSTGEYTLLGMPSG